MERRNFHEKVLYRVENGAILACICLFTPFLGINDVTRKNILVLAGVLTLFTGASLLSARRKGLYLLLAVMCMSVTVIIMGARTGFTFWNAYLKWCMGGGEEQSQWLEAFRLLHTAFLTAVSYLIQLLTEKFKALRMGLACALAVGMLVCLFLQVSLTHMSVVFALIYIVLVCVERLQDRWKKTRSGNLMEQMFWLSPFLGVYLLLMSVMPAPETPYDWQWARMIYSQIRESFIVMSQNIMRGSRDDFDTAMSGFSDDGELGGGVRKNDREIIRIQSGSIFATNVYLIGKVYDTFDGRQWQQEYSSDEGERFIDSMETLYAVRRLDNGHVDDYLKWTNISIQYEFFNTGYVLAPLKTIRIAGSEKDLDYFFAGGDLILGERKGYDTEYDVIYYQLNVGEELFKRLLEEQADPDAHIWETITREFESSMGRKVTLEEAEAHRQIIYDNYSDQTILSKEVESYLSQIIGDAETSLDKLRAIERELSSYTYTTTPGRLPDSVTNAGEFLNYFLLESRQGYCTYFATAFVLLARAEGIPARYVQGFCVPAAGSREAVVLSSMAHSWPEVYIDGVGWIPFEPTPGFGQLRYRSWRVSEREDISSSETDLWWDREGADTMPSAAGGELGEGAGYDDQFGEEWNDVEPDDQEFGEVWDLERFIRMIISGISVIFIGFVLALVLDNLISFYRYQRMSLKEKLKVEVNRNLRVLSLLGLKREEYETLQELHERTASIPELEAMHFIEDYEDILYGEKSGSEEMLERAQEERRQIYILLRKEKKLAYIFYWMRMFAVRYR